VRALCDALAVMAAESKRCTLRLEVTRCTKASPALWSRFEMASPSLTIPQWHVMVSDPVACLNNVSVPEIKQMEPSGSIANSGELFQTAR
jgi:hypothetical protein